MFTFCLNHALIKLQTGETMREKNIIDRIKEHQANKEKELIDRIIKEQALRERGVIILNDYKKEKQLWVKKIL